MVIIVSQRADVHQTFDIHLAQLHKQTEAGDRTDHTLEFFTNAAADVLTFQEIHHIAGCIIGATFGHGAVLSHVNHRSNIVRINAVLLQWLGTLGALHMFALALAADNAADTAVYQQIRVAADRRSEVCIRFVRQAKMAFVFRLIHGLTE